MRKTILVPAFILLLLPVTGSWQSLPAAPGYGFAIDNGDVNGDMERDVTDVVYLLSGLFLGGPEAAPLASCDGLPQTLKNGDVNGDGALDVSDPIGLLGWLFVGSSEPVAPCGEGVGAAKNSNPRVIPAQAKAFGKSYGEWGAAWQQWCFYTTTENCPVTDNTGEHALVAQSGKVYFLAGTFGEYLGTPWAAPNPVTRTVTIPAGIALCLPLLNWGLIYPEDNQFASAPPDASPEEAIPLFYAALNGAFDNTPETDMACVVDGVALKGLRSYRAQSAPFQAYVPRVNVQNDLMDYYMYGKIPPPSGTFYAEGWHLSVSDGYYVMLPPLSAGKHTIYLRGGPAASPFCVVTYNLTVKGGK